MTRTVLLVALAVASCASPRRAVEQASEPAASAWVPSAAAPKASDAAVSRTAQAADGGAPDVEARPTLSRRLELREAGKEPRRALRHAFAKGSRQKLRVEIVTRVLEKDRAVAEARIEAPLDVTIVEVRGDGSADFRYELGPVKARGTGAGPLSFVPRDAGIGQLSGHATVAASGELRDHRPATAVGEGAPEAELLKSLFSSVLELPQEPVGPGGRWELVLEAESGEIAIVHTTSYELSGFVGPKVKIRVGQHEQIRVPDGGALNRLVTAPSAGEWLAEPGRVFPAGRQAMKAGVLADTSGELFTEIRLVPR
jgi:hypothetical protein